MLQSTLEPLVAPRTSSPLSLAKATRSGTDVMEGELVCSDGKSFAIREGIPSFVPESSLRNQTVQSFNQKWEKHQYYREHTRRFYTQWYLDRYGFLEQQALRNFLRTKRFILDAGTGSGRDALNFAEHSEATVYALDTSWEALSAARRQVAHSRVAFVHADLHELPFPDGFFDFINCDQVIHHTPDPRAAFECLARKLKRGGDICCYVYRKKSPLREYSDDFVRERISHLPADEALALCEGITRLGKTLSDLQITVNVEEDVPFLGIKKGAIDLQRLFHWHIMKCFWNDEFDFFTNNIVNFDWYHPQHCHRFEPDEFRGWFSNGWDIQAWDTQEAGLSCRARKI